MRVMGVLLLIGIFLVLPMVLVSTVVIPQVEQLEYTYSDMDEIATRAIE